MPVFSVRSDHPAVTECIRNRKIVATNIVVTYIVFVMGEALRKRLKQTTFHGPVQEAILNLMVAAGYLSGRFDAICNGFGISHQQYNILRILRGAGEEGHQCGEIGVRMLDRAPDVTRRLDGLVKLGLVVRDRLESDRRVVITRITDKGLGLLARIDPKMEELESYVADRLSPGECLELSRLCEALYSDDS